MQQPDKISYRLQSDILKRLVRKLAASSSNIVITEHAEERMYERDINFETVLKILRTGEIHFEHKDKKGNSVIRATKNVVSKRDASVVTAVVNQTKQLILITVMWDDPE